jgi:hypothetical protein
MAARYGCGAAFRAGPVDEALAELDEMDVDTPSTAEAVEDLRGRIEILMDEIVGMSPRRRSAMKCCLSGFFGAQQVNAVGIGRAGALRRYRHHIAEAVMDDDAVPAVALGLEERGVRTVDQNGKVFSIEGLDDTEADGEFR